MIVMNKYPYNSGHLMALPLAHKGRIEELTDAEYLDLSQELRRAVRVLEAVYKPGGFNIGMNHGDVAGAGIPAHLHWHVIPRWLGDTNFFPLIAETKVLPETIEQSFAKVAAEFARTA
jgi:ATP adenylyltransferase